MVTQNPYRTVTAATNRTPQTSPMPGDVGARQSVNNAGGYVFTVDMWDQLNRFLIIGTVGGTYYVSERKLTDDNAKVVFQCAAEDGQRLVNAIIDVSVNGRAQKQEPTLLALAIAAAAPDVETRRAALAAVNDVCRTGTHLFMFIGFAKQFRGLGRGLRSAIARWYQQDASKVAYQAVKYRSREGYTHRDALRLAHPRAVGASDALFSWVTQGTPIPDEHAGPLSIVAAYEQAQAAATAADTARVLRDNPGLPWEALKTEHLNDPKVLNLLLDNGMPTGALIRQLPRLTRAGVARDRKAVIVAQLTDPERIAKSRVHPMSILNALVTYRDGAGRGGRDWDPVAQVIDGLDQAFYLAFDAVTPANKRTLLALDVSGSMAGGWGHSMSAGMALSPREITAAMAMVTARTEPDYEFMGFGHEFVKLGITPRQRLDDAVKAISGIPFGATDCSLPMVWAMVNNVKIDTFTVWTDNETYAGRVHPVEALAEYRQRMQIPAKLVVVSTVPTPFTIADPTDPGMLDVVGFDTATPDLIAGFSRGDF